MTEGYRNQIPPASTDGTYYDWTPLRHEVVVPPAVIQARLLRFHDAFGQGPSKRAISRSRARLLPAPFHCCQRQAKATAQLLPTGAKPES